MIVQGEPSLRPGASPGGGGDRRRRCRRRWRAGVAPARR